MNEPPLFWADPRLVYTVAAAGVALLLITIWLFRRRRTQGRQAAVVCLILSIALHASLFYLVPLLPSPNGGSPTVQEQTESEAGIDSIAFSTFDPDLMMAEASGESASAPMAPLPMSTLDELIEPAPAPEQSPESEPLPAETEPDPMDDVTDTESIADSPAEFVPESLEQVATDPLDDASDPLEAQLSEMLASAFASEDSDSPESTPGAEPDTGEKLSSIDSSTTARTIPPVTRPAATGRATPNTVPGAVENDFANRTGAAKQLALIQTGGSAETEAAVAAALRFLAESQRADGSWDPRASGAGKERAPLGMTRGGAGSQAETAITGLALLAMMGAGNTHHDGPYAENVYRGLAYLIQNQQPNGSLAGNASIYAANYSHGMAALALCEAAAITQDPSALASAQRAIAHTRRMQHPTTGGWRYTENDPGDLSQLGWQAMVLDAGQRAGIPIDRTAMAGVKRFLASVRMGSRGGLACYRPREAASRTMTAEALATRLLIGERVPALEVAEAERYLLQNPPGVGQDNYYYWYYATLALHQLQDDAWTQWNGALKRRLIATQRGDGGWSSDTLWGGYGGTVYTTSMAALCLESYYRHVVRGGGDRMANRQMQLNSNQRN